MDMIIFAPNVHRGGGLVLLAALCQHWPEHRRCLAFLDARAQSSVKVPPRWDVRWVPRSFLGRLRAERQLARLSRQADRVLCFHNLPPVFHCDSQVICFVQNLNLIEISDPTSLSGWVRVRHAAERFIARTFRANVDRYVVQTPTMARALRHWLPGGPGAAEVSIRQMPFIDPQALPAPKSIDAPEANQWDFIYVSDGQAHKNHARLFEAWAILSEEGLRPSLAVTLNPDHDGALVASLVKYVARHQVDIVNLGQMPHSELLSCYGRAKAMLFASFAESFGIPFLEARAAGLPIVAAELDFVRDMCEPVETFDPFSAVSIARSVKRFLGKGEPPLQPLTPRDFIDELIALESPSH